MVHMGDEFSLVNDKAPQEENSRRKAGQTALEFVESFGQRLNVMQKGHKMFRSDLGEERLTEVQAKVKLRNLGWKTFGKHFWYTERQGLKAHTKHGLTLREATSLECISYDSEKGEKNL